MKIQSKWIMESSCVPIFFPSLSSVFKASSKQQRRIKTEQIHCSTYKLSGAFQTQSGFYNSQNDAELFSYLNKESKARGAFETTTSAATTSFWCEGGKMFSNCIYLSLVEFSIGYFFAQILVKKCEKFIFKLLHNWRIKSWQGIQILHAFQLNCL